MDAELMDARKADLQRYVGAHGMPPLLDGPFLERFKAEETSKAILSEVNRAHVMGWTKIQISLDLKDAYDLAQFLANAR